MQKTRAALPAGLQGSGAEHLPSAPCRKALYWVCRLGTHALQQTHLDSNSGSPSDELWDSKQVTSPCRASISSSVNGDRLKSCLPED